MISLIIYSIILTHSDVVIVLYQCNDYMGSKASNTAHESSRSRMDAALVAVLVSLR